MKALLHQYALYNLETNSLFGTMLGSIPDSVLNADMKNSFPSIFKTYLHLLDVEAIWWQRLQNQQSIILPSVSFTGGISACNTAFKIQSQLWTNWILHATEAEFDQAIVFTNTDGVPVSQRISQVLIHLFSHQGYHRGQIVTMLRQQGITQNLPGAGFIDFVRTNEG